LNKFDRWGNPQQIARKKLGCKSWLFLNDTSQHDSASAKLRTHFANFGSHCRPIWSMKHPIPTENEMRMWPNISIVWPIADLIGTIWENEPCLIRAWRPVWSPFWEGRSDLVGLTLIMIRNVATKNLSIGFSRHWRTASCHWEARVLTYDLIKKDAGAGKHCKRKTTCLKCGSRNDKTNIM
jgi:hypothetical protein